MSTYDSVASRANNIGMKYVQFLTKLSEAEATGHVLPDIHSSNDVIAELKTDLANNWDFKYICGHGVLAPELSPAIVPPRTYIRFHSPAGCVAVISGEHTGLVPIMAFPEIFVQNKVPFIRDMVHSYLNNSGPLESFTSIKERNNLIREPYPAEFCLTPGNPFSESKRCLAPEYTKQTIYMPGESIPQMRISFSNNPYQTLMLGVYDLPMDAAGFYNAVQSTAENIAEEGHSKPSINEMSDDEFRAAMTLQHNVDTLLFKNDSFPFRDETGHPTTIHNPNLAKDVIGRTVTLTEVLTALPPVPVGKVRFLFINSCRGVPRVLEDTGMAANVLHAWDETRKPPALP